eukprot:symbB.v1.2.027865.t1/scaffold2894.1/size68075/2
MGSLEAPQGASEACQDNSAEVVTAPMAGPRSPSRLQLPSRQEPSREKTSDASEDEGNRYEASLERSGSAVAWGFAWNVWGAWLFVLPLLSTGQLINQTEREKLEKLFPLCFQHWLSALLMPRSVANQRNYRKALAEETLLILEEGGYSSPSADCWVDIAEALERSCDNSFVLHEDDDLPPAPSGVPGNDVVIDVTEETSLQALYRLAQEEVGPIVLLNFASAKNPGGGFLGGAQAQEESLARSSGLYQCLMQFKDDLYANNKKDPRGGFYSHDMIFSPQVPFFRKDKGALLSSLVLCSVVSAPAVNAGVVGAKSERVMQVMQYRLRRVLHLARSQRATPTLILGAWGCGVFQNSPEDVAKLFSDVLHEQQFSSSFRRAVFAVPDAKMKSIFEDVLLGSMPRSLPAPTPVKSAWQWDVAGCDSDGYADAAEVVCASPLKR